MCVCVCVRAYSNWPGLSCWFVIRQRKESGEEREEMTVEITHTTVRSRGEVRRALMTGASEGRGSWGTW